MNSNQQDNHKKRADRHKEKDDANKGKKYKSRSERHKHKKVKTPSKKKIKMTRSEHFRHKPIEKKENENEEVGQRSQTKKGFIPKLKHVILSFGIIFVLALIAYTTILYGGKLFVDENKLLITPPTTIETTNGEIIWYLYNEYRLPVNLEEIPEHVQNAFVATEDKRFYSHSGLDFRSIFRAIYKDILARSKVEGGSTITQQLAKNLFLTNDKSWLRKTKEVMIALYLEREFTKDEILEMYLNAIYFGQGQYGIEAASNKFFHKSVGDLTLEEGALLAGLVNAPNGYSPIDHPEKALNRRNLVIQRLYEQELITTEEMESAQAKEIELNLTQRKINPAYQTFVNMVIEEAEETYDISEDELKENRYRIITSMDEKAQQIAYDQFQYDGYFPGNNKDSVEGAFVMMKEDSGEVVAAIGGRQYQLRNLNRVVQMKRQPGSVMKPLAVYGPALETEEFTPYMMLPDEKKEWDGKEVRNYNDQYEGSVSFYEALVRSKNTTAVWLLNEIGIDYASTFLTEMNMQIDKEKDSFNIALGGLTNGLSPLQLVEAYRIFVHAGEMIDAHTIIEIKNQKGNTAAAANPETKEIFSPQVAWTITEMLQGVVEKGTGTAGSYPHELAGKTGTTQDNNDIWFVGYTPEYVTALWMGYDKVDEDHYLTGGSSYPTELTKKILTELDEESSLVANFTKPDNVQAMAEPIELPTVTDLSSTFVFGGFKILKGKLEWPSSGDDRIVYRIFEQEDGEDEQIGEVVGGTEFVIDEFLLFQKRSYYIVPYDPLGERQGEASNTVEISF